MVRASDVAAALEELAPKNLAESWDNVGLQIGNPADRVDKILVALEVTTAVLDEAEQMGANMVVTHHPLIFSPMKQVDTGSSVGRLVGAMICRQVNLYVAHTNMDIARGGVSDRLAEVLGLTRVEPLQMTGREALYKLAVYVPEEALTAVRDALCAAGAGGIGKYDWCSFAGPGTGTFRPKEGANPAIGEVGKLEFVAEQKLEVIITEHQLSGAIASMLRAHPYEEVAYDILRLENPGPARGIGRVGWLSKPGTLEEVARLAAIQLGSHAPRISGDPQMQIERIAICGGSGRNLAELAARAGAQALLAGDLGHHDGLAAQALGVGLIDLGHYATERPIVEPMAQHLREKLRGVDVLVSQVDTDPFRTV